ncbi:Cytochrome c [Cribrihabitans marinus]|uniref:Cytochrome c n=1 Tax=Cribrihabitans marinus TaxID=1227549 RepID=A0A1H6QNH8_9RHOB|nr:cytochrome c [Cribrihabitans marinus]GGH18392.1 hypothetical protein GCM10010973_01170 [Cribrihabitans marinus]SEI40825.1 Cytochrome c [Cribrihabitans marinus]
MKQFAVSLAAIVTISVAPAAFGASHGDDMTMMSPGIVIPSMDSSRGRLLFASKGCVVCHSINGVGGVDASMLDAEFMDLPMNPFDFAARMWRGAPFMIEAQEDELGYQIDLTGQELADIIAFVHDPDEQEKFSESDIPEELEELMEHQEEEAHD